MLFWGRLYHPVRRPQKAVENSCRLVIPWTTCRLPSVEMEFFPALSTGYIPLRSMFGVFISRSPSFVLKPLSGTSKAGFFPPTYFGEVRG